MNRRSPCPLACTLDLIGDRWTLLIIRDMLFFQKTKFAEFLDSPEKISTNILTDRLRKLEGAGLVEKAPYNRQRMAYTATEKGKSLAPILKQLVEWGMKNLEKPIRNNCGKRARTRTGL